MSNRSRARRVRRARRPQADAHVVAYKAWKQSKEIKPALHDCIEGVGDGYVVLDSFLPADSMERFEKNVRKHMKEDNLTGNPINLAEVNNSANKERRAIKGSLFKGGAGRDINKIRDKLTKLCFEGAGEFRHGTFVETKVENPGQRKHSDANTIFYQEFNPHTIVLSAVVPISERRCLYVYPGRFDMSECGRLRRPVAVTVKRGQVLVFNGQLIHHGAPGWMNAGLEHSPDLMSRKRKLDTIRDTRSNLMLHFYGAHHDYDPDKYGANPCVD